jgi:hypothetical protein
MRSRLRLVAFVGLLGLLATSCFTLRGFSFSKAIVDPGEKNILNLRLQPGVEESTDQGLNRDYPFVILGLSRPSASDPAFIRVVKPRRFDVGGNFGGPRALQRDDGLRDLILANNWCSGFDVVSSDSTLWLLFRTGSQVNDRERVGKYAMSQLGLKPAADTTLGVGQLQIVVGGWIDDEDGLAESGEVFCNSAADTSMLINQPPTTSASSSAARAWLRQLSRGS